MEEHRSRNGKTFLQCPKCKAKVTEAEDQPQGTDVAV